MRYGSKPDYIPPLSQLRDQLLSGFACLMGQPGIDERERGFVWLEGVTTGYVLNALKKMGWDLKRGETFSTAHMASVLGIVKRHRRLLERLLMMLADDRILGRSDALWEIISEPPTPDKNVRPGAACRPDAEAELLDHCGSVLAEVLQGKIDPVQVLFPDGDSTLVSRVYLEAFVLREMNIMVQKTLSLALSRLPPAQGCRILEIGAGTGSTALSFLPHLPPDRTEYTFTDVSPAFVREAEEKFRDYPFVRYGVLNIEQDPAAQGFESHHYDFVVATNVFHATRDLADTLRNARQLLAPGGMLVFLEVTAPVRWIDLVFGLTQGWWRFTDTDLRPSYPLVSAAKWIELLYGCGFEEAFSISPDDLVTRDHASAGRKVFPQSLIAAKAPAKGGCDYPFAARLSR